MGKGKVSCCAISLALIKSLRSFICAFSWESTNSNSPSGPAIKESPKVIANLGLSVNKDQKLKRAFTF